MTTIATDGTTMAVDRLVSGDGLNHGTITKIVQLDDGTIIGHTGTAFQVTAFIEWYRSDQTTPFDGADDMEALVLLPNGQIRCYNKRGESYAAPAPQAVGSGAAVAYGALDAGADPVRAVEIASYRNLYTGGGVDSYSIR